MVKPARDHSGVGLQIIKYRAEMIGGAVEVRADEKQGATVTCKFPIESENGGK